MEFGAKSVVYQFCRPAKIPIYLEFNLPEFSPGLPKYFQENGWVALKEEEKKQAQLEINTNVNARYCSLAPAYGAMLDRIGYARPEDKWGKESVGPGPLGSVYRYKGIAIAAYRPRSTRWEMAALYDFGSSAKKIESSIVMSRFLSWAFAAQAMVGIWGQVQDSGIILARDKEIGGKAIFIDLNNRRCLTFEGEKMLSHYPVFLRLTSQLREDSQRLSSEELLAWLLSHSVLFDYDPMPVLIQKIFSNLARQSQGTRILRSKVSGILQMPL